MNAIETAGLSKKFGNMYAVQDLNLHVPEGSIYGSIGENGTLIKEMRGDEMSEECRDFVFVKTSNDFQAIPVLSRKYREIEQKDEGIRIYDEAESSNVGSLLYANGIPAS